MNYSLVGVSERHEDGTVSGTWLQNVMGSSLAGAIDRAVRTNEVNSNRMTIAITEYSDGGRLSFFRIEAIDIVFPQSPEKILSDFMKNNS